jgi:hypothetical protein
MFRSRLQFLIALLFYILRSPGYDLLIVVKDLASIKKGLINNNTTSLGHFQFGTIL